MEETARFYGDVLGLKLLIRFNRKGEYFGCYLDCGAMTHIEVFHRPEAEFAETDRINHFCLETTGLDNAIAHIRAQGVEITDKKKAVDHSWQAWLKDPNGTRIELFEYTGESMQLHGGVAEANW
jgi:predicted enzyme related to lactoylglutathione lyase